MHILLPIAAYIAFLAFAPWAAIQFAVWFVIVTGVVRASAQRLSGAEVGISESAKSILYAAVLPLLAMLVLGAFSAPPGTLMLGGPAVLVLVLLAGSFVGAFMWSLGTDLKTSAIVASIALVTSIAVAVLLRLSSKLAVA